VDDEPMSSLYLEREPAPAANVVKL
jgi:hypothetical protein